MKKIIVIHGPNLNLLGVREPEVYSTTSLDSINNKLKLLCKKNNVSVDLFQSNHEGDIVSKIQSCLKNCDGILINPAAYTHTSVAIRDALLTVTCPIVEVHLSNIFKREEFRKSSLISDIVSGIVIGFGPNSYELGLQALLKLI